MNRRTQWIFVLASFVAVNGVLATVFLSQAGRSAEPETAVAILGIVSEDIVATSSTSTPPTTSTPVEAAVQAPDQSVVEIVIDAPAPTEEEGVDVVPSTVVSPTESSALVAEALVVAVGDPEPVEELVEEAELVEKAEAAEEPELVEEVEADVEPQASAFSTVETPDGGTPVAHAEVSLIVAHSGPSGDSSVLESFANPTPRGGELVFQATGLTSTTGTVGLNQEEWIEVLLPVRPNGTKGWIKRSQVKVTVNPYRIDIDLSRHELVVYRYGEQRMATAIGVGKGGTPTPIGGFYLTELLRPSNPSGAYGPFAYGLSGYSDTLTSFNGGPGAIGIHGTNSPGLLGSDVSHGCIRVANPIITKMAEFLPLGTPVTIND